MRTLLSAGSGIGGWGLLALLFVGYHQDRYDDPETAFEWLRSLLTLVG